MSGKPTGQPSFWARLQTVPDGLSPEEQRLFIAYVYALPLGLTFHFLFIFIFWQLGYSVLTLYNVFSVFAFSLANWRIYAGDLKTTTFLCILFEVPVHAILATLYLGFDAGFWLLAFISAAAVMITPFFSRPIRFIIAIGFTMLLGVVAILAIANGAIYILPDWLAYTFLLVNLFTLSLIVTVIIASYDLAVETAEAALQIEFERAESLLLNILPAPIADRLKAQEEPLADSLNSVTVLFTDIAGFTNMSRGMTAEALVTLLNDLFTRFDVLVEKHDAEKIKTIGDAYMIATGLDGSADHATRMVDLAQDMHAAFEEFRNTHQLDLGLRTGLHSGAAVAGVIGKQKFAYDLWGDTVNVASRMESSGIPDRIQISSETLALLPDDPVVEPRGMIEIKGHAARQAYLIRPTAQGTLA